MFSQSSAPGNLSLCGESSLFFVWRPKARFIAPNGWMNDPQGLFQLSDGTFHAGYQCNPDGIVWGNISQCAAFSPDLTFWQDVNSWKNPRTMYPSEPYDIAGVFDGTVIEKGYQGFPTTIYTGIRPGSIGASVQPAEIEGTETQSLAYTADGGCSWIKVDANPIISKWPAKNLTGFRDPYVFDSPILSSLLPNTTATGPLFLTISGGRRADAYPKDLAGPVLFLYRQKTTNNFLEWTYISLLVHTRIHSSFSEWSGGFGISYEASGVTRLNELGMAGDDGNDERALNVVGLGTEQGRNGSHEDHWPLWAFVDFKSTHNGTQVTSDLTAVGVFDWGRVYATVFFPVSLNRSVLVGWTYEDDENLVLTKQRGYQGAFTLFRDIFLKVVKNVDPKTECLYSPGNWKVWSEADGTVSIVTLGQKIIPETLSAYRKHSKISTPETTQFISPAGYIPFKVQPSDRFYVIQATIDFTGTNLTAGFRILASNNEHTDILYDISSETLRVFRHRSSLIETYGKDTEEAKLRLWNILDPVSGHVARQSLNLTVVVDNSVLEVHANEVTVITTRVYPWLLESRGAGMLISGKNDCEGGDGGCGVKFSNMELWDGLIDAWPQRPVDTRRVHPASGTC